MAWTTVYISGKTDFKEEVRRKLQHSSLPHMPGFMEERHGTWFNDLYWVDGTVGLRKFKETVSGKLVWKHRLQFFTSLEDFLKSQETKRETEFTSREREMIDEMRAAS